MRRCKQAGDCWGRRNAARSHGVCDTDRRPARTVPNARGPGRADSANAGATMRTLIVATTLVALLSCASGGSTTASRAVSGPAEGMYDFVATVPGQAVRGTLQITADTVFFSPLDGCNSNIRSEPIGRTSNAGVFRYSCNSAVLAIDRRNPERSSRWSATVNVARLRKVCAERAVRDGREVCIRTTIERYDVPESRSGSIQVTRRR